MLSPLHISDMKLLAMNQLKVRSPFHLRNKVCDGLQCRVPHPYDTVLSEPSFVGLGR